MRLGEYPQAIAPSEGASEIDARPARLDGESIAIPAGYPGGAAAALQSPGFGKPLIAALSLFRLGYRSDVLQRQTLEDASTSRTIWMGQRTRWFKGWMQKSSAPPFSPSKERYFTTCKSVHLGLQHVGTD